MQADETIDAVGTYCPMPIILTQKKIKEMNAGEVLEILADDDGIKEDMPAWCADNGHELLAIKDEMNIYKIYIRKLH